MVVTLNPTNIRPVCNYPKEQPWPRRRIVGGTLNAALAAILSYIATEFSPIGYETSAAYDHRFVTNGLEPANVGWRTNAQ
jgi:hypothetical protein